MKHVEFKYDIGDEVKITAIGLRGTIDSLLWSIYSQKYCVIYWCNGTRHDEWMYVFEIEPVAKP